jgi:hypothetical protein
VSQGASVNDVDKHNKSIAHQASYSGMNTLLRRVLEKGCYIANEGRHVRIIFNKYYSVHKIE